MPYIRTYRYVYAIPFSSESPHFSIMYELCCTCVNYVTATFHHACVGLCQVQRTLCTVYNLNIIYALPQRPGLNGPVHWRKHASRRDTHRVQANS